MKNAFCISIMFAVAMLSGCGSQFPSSVKEEEKGLKNYYSDYFPVGVAVSPRALKTEEAELIKREFNSMTAENVMKMGPIHPEENEYFWADADSIVAFAERNNMKMRGHTLCWHNQIPDWMFVDAQGDTVSKKVLLGRLKDHITEVVTRYRKIYAWDVANEVISDQADEFCRPSPWYKICGEDYIAEAFRYVHEADPQALLFYNDYNEIDSLKYRQNRHDRLLCGCQPDYARHAQFSDHETGFYRSDLWRNGSGGSAGRCSAYVQCDRHR